MLRRHACLSLISLLGGAAARAADQSTSGRWKMQYFFDESENFLFLSDFQFSSAAHGIASGQLENKGRIKPAVLVTSDGGAHWQMASIGEVPTALAVLDDSRAWIGTAKGAWRTTDGGRQWQKLSGPKEFKGISELYFESAARGWALGGRSDVWETADGGMTWKPALGGGKEAVEGNPQYCCVTFANPQMGVIIGTKFLYGRPTQTVLVQTVDGGKTWSTAAQPASGTIDRARFLKDGTLVYTVRYPPGRPAISELRAEKPKERTSRALYTGKELLVSDFAVTSAGRWYLAAVRRTSISPVPGAVVVLSSDDAEHWQEMPVDYRAAGREAYFSAVDDTHLWLATDTGMILRLTNESA